MEVNNFDVVDFAASCFADTIFDALKTRERKKSVTKRIKTLADRTDVKDRQNRCKRQTDRQTDRSSFSRDNIPSVNFHINTENKTGLDQLQDCMFIMIRH